MKMIGLTGGIGSGKSTVARIFEHMDFPVFYSDKVAALLMDHDPLIRDFLKKLTGESMHTDQGLNRKKLADYLFNDKALLNKVNEFVHPLVGQEFDRWASKQHARLIINEAAVFIETGSFKRFDKVILVTAPVEMRIQRVMKRDKSTRMEVERRIANQWTDEQKIPFSDYVITNDGSPLLIQIEGIIDQLITS